MHPFQLLTFAAFLHTAAGQWAAPHGFGGPAAFAPASPSHQSCGSQPLPSSAPVSSAGPLAGMIKHVAVISVDGMHASDIAKYLAVRPQAFIKTMLQTGYEYTNAFTSAPSDSFPGTVAQWSGATPAYSGIWYDDAYDYNYWPAGTDCQGPSGAEVLYDETIEYNDTLLFSSINPANLPLALINGICTPIYPHMRLRTNTVFEVAHSKGLTTAYSDKHAAYDLVRGPSGTGLTSGYFPEQAWSGNNGTVAGTIAYDSLRVSAFLDWLDGVSPAHSQGNISEVPAVFGGNFQSLNVAQKNTSGGYLNTTGNPPSALVIQALDFVDQSLAAFVAKLKANDLYESTLIIVASKHGQAPINPSLFAKVDPALLTSALGVPAAQITADDIALIWLNSTSDIATATTNLARNANELKILNIFAGANQTAMGFGSPLSDERVPSIIVQPDLGVIYTTSKKKISEHGGLSDDDRHVACFVSHPSLKQTVFNETVMTTQVAPTVLKMLGIDPMELMAVVAEGTQELPGL